VTFGLLPDKLKQWQLLWAFKASPFRQLTQPATSFSNLTAPHGYQ
jgi:hypothetical protein